MKAVNKGFLSQTLSVPAQKLPGFHGRPGALPFSLLSAPAFSKYIPDPSGRVLFSLASHFLGFLTLGLFPSVPPSLNALFLLSLSHVCRNLLYFSSSISLRTHLAAYLTLLCNSALKSFLSSSEASFLSRQIGQHHIMD